MSYSSKKQSIREATVSLLENANIDNINGIYANRTSSFWKDELPCISVFCAEENATPQDLANTKYLRTLNLRIEIHAEATEDLDNLLDQASQTVEELILENQSISGQVLGLTLQSSNMELLADATKPIGVSTLNFELKYIK